MADEKPVEQPAAKPAEKPAGVAGAVGFILVVVIGAAIGSFVTRSKTPAAAGSTSLAEARAAATAGDRKGAALAFAKVVDEDPDSGDAREAKEELAKLAELSLVATVPLEDAARVLEAARDGAAVVKSSTVAEACLRASAEAAKDPKGACALMEVVAKIAQGPEVQQARVAALDAAIAKDAEDIPAHVARAELDLDAGDWKKAEVRLVPLEAKLGDGDGARALGLALLKLDVSDRSFALLKRYYDAHLDAFRRALDGLKAADMTARQKAVEDLRAGTFSPAFQRKMDEADKDTKKRLVDGWVRERVLRDKTVKNALRSVLAAQKLVEPAVALAQLEVKLAGDKPAERRKHLENAEGYYLSVLELAGGDSALLFVARVRFDLGREKEAKEMLDELYRRHGRTGELLLGLAVTFQQVAAAREATRELAEEAWGKLAEPPLKEKAAWIRASVTANPVDAIAWFERAGDKAPVKAMLAHRRAQVAADEGRFDEAKDLLDQVLSFLERNESPPEQVGALRLQRFTLSGDRGDLDRTIQTLDKASGPDARADRLDLLADVLLTRAIFDVVKDRVKTDAIRDRSLELFHFAAKDEKDLEALIGLLTAHTDRVRALELRERALKLDETREETWEGLLADASSRRDLLAVESLADRIAKAPLDRVESRRRLDEYWTGKSDATYRDGVERKRKYAEAVLARARAANEPTSIARALVARANVEQGAPTVGATGDLDLAVKLCDEAVSLAPRPFTQSALLQALLARALERSKKAGGKTLADLARDHGKLGAPAVLALAARADSSVAEALAKDEDVKRAATLVPADGEPQTLHLRALSLAKSETRDAFAKRLADSKLVAARAKASHALQPESPECVLELVAVLEARGDKEGAAKVLDAAKKASVALPFDALR